MFRRRRTPGFGIILLISQILQAGRVPPVTLAIIALNTVIFLRLLPDLPTVSQACISFHHVWYNNQWQRIFYSPFFHLDDMHLYFNMVSLLWKGTSLESRLGAARLLYLISVFSVLTSLMLLLVDNCMFIFLDDPSYLYTCAAGFSGVIFALKVLTTYHQPAGYTYVMMFPVPNRMACWVELILIRLLVPRSSFTGHLAGILVGLLYVKGPLKILMDVIANIFEANQVRRQYTYHTGTTGETISSYDDNDDEQLQAAIRESLRETSNQQIPSNIGSNYNEAEYLNNDEIRRRRLQRFQT